MFVFYRVTMKGIRKTSEKRHQTSTGYLCVFIGIAVLPTLNIFAQKSNQFEFGSLTEHAH